MKNRVKMWIVFLLLCFGVSQLSVQPTQAAQELAVNEERLVIFEIFTRAT
jgi:hypothetical protein